ncbi:MAG: TfoX/Sxy family protein [Gammaproteobacteria bacterium]|nr:TfoX/Sxy family protein [Gammaproteobacteria bacterium]
MTVSKDFSTYVHEQLRMMSALTSRRMFGGIGLYSEGLFFALLDDDTLYCKVDDGNRLDYVQRGMRAFTPFPDKPGMNYYEVPAEVLEDAEELARWARKSVAAARAAASRKAKTQSTSRKSRVRAIGKRAAAAKRRRQ